MFDRFVDVIDWLLPVASTAHWWRTGPAVTPSLWLSALLFCAQSLSASPLPLQWSVNVKTNVSTQRYDWMNCKVLLLTKTKHKTKKC